VKACLIISYTFDIIWRFHGYLRGSRVSFLRLSVTVTGLISAFCGIAIAGMSEALTLVTTVIGLSWLGRRCGPTNFFMNRIDVMSPGLENKVARVVSPRVHRAL
jgi:hypothetical protein